MRSKKIYISLLLMGSLILSSCVKEEEELAPSNIESGYTVPQGEHDFDDDIVDFYDKYGSYLLYEFTEKDAYWTPSAWQNGAETSEDEEGSVGFIIEMPNVDYVDQELTLLNDTWFNYYSDEFLKEFLPIKILLCSNVGEVGYSWDANWNLVYVASPISAYYNYDNICVNYTSEEIETLTDDDKTSIAFDLNHVFVESIIGQEKLTITSEFENSANYNNASSLYNNTDLWGIGIFQPYYDASAENDWGIFLTMMMCYSEEYLNREVSSVSEWDYEETSWEGIFSSQKDINGLLKERYNMVRQYYIDNYNMDLQTVGNAVYQ